MTVSDPKGKPVDGLLEADFELLDNGKPRKFDADGAIQPIAIVIAVQTSANSAAALTKIQRIGGMIEPLITGARGTAAMVAFDDEVRTIAPFTSDATRALRPRGSGARLIDGVAESMRLLREGPPNHRRVILLISEMRDRSSESKLEDVLTTAQRENVTIYSITYSPMLSQFAVKQHEIPPPAGMDLLALFIELRQQGKASAADAFTTHTGGRRLSFLKQNALENAITSIGEELHSQYHLSFAPDPSDRGSYHRIEVRVKSRPEAQVRARPGYWLE